MSWLDITVMVVPLVLAGTVALLLIRTILQPRKQSTPQALPQASRPKRSMADQSPPVRRGPPPMQSPTADANTNKTKSKDSVFGQAGRDAISSPPPSRPPASVGTFWSDLKGEHWQQTAGSLRTLFDAYLAGNGEQFDISRVITRDLISVDGESIVPNLHVLPSHLALVLIDIQLAAKAAVGEAIFSNQAVIRQALQRVQDQYDYIIFDCSPNFNLITQNGLFASDSYVIPAIPDYPSTLEISLIQGEVSDFSERIGTALSMFGGSFSGPALRSVIFTRVRLRSKKPLRFIDLHERRIHEVHWTGGEPKLSF